MEKKAKFTNYWPLIAMILVSGLAALALNYSSSEGILHGMHHFMGLLFCQFALFKLFNVPGFANGFQMYDVIAKRSRFYALIYPFIELTLGLAYLSFLFPSVTYTVTVFFMAIGSIGVIQSLRKGLDIKCACMGTILNVPLSTVTLTEDLSMGAMALGMLLFQ